MPSPVPTNTDPARLQMVNQQVRAWDVLDPAVLRVLRETPRERFVPAAYRSLAFADTAIPLPEGQFMMTPQVEGRTLQALEIKPTDSVLEVGTGSGFLAACLAQLGARVTSVEIRPALAEAARRTLQQNGIGNCEVLTGDIFQWHPAGEFDCIAVTGSLPVYDPRFQEWLTPGGRLFVVVGEEPSMEARRIRQRERGDFASGSLFETVLAPLDNATRPEKFVF